MPTMASRLAVELADRLRADPRLQEAGLRATATEVQGWIDKRWLGPRRVERAGHGTDLTLLDADAYEVAVAMTCLQRKDRTDQNVLSARRRVL